MHKKYFLILSYFLSVSQVFSIQEYQQDTVNKSQNQLLPTPTTNLDEFHKQPLYTRDSVSSFLTRVYNHRHYSEKFLALNFSHVATLLSYTNQSLQPRAYIKMVLKLFSQKLKSTTFVNSYAFLELVSRMPELLRDYFPQNSEQETKDKFKACLYDFFLNNFKDLKKDPEQSLSTLADKMYHVSRTLKNNNDLPVTELQQCVLQFFEISLSKLVWSPEDNIDVWDSVKSIAYTLEALMHLNAIPNAESLDELYWTLIHRFCYFLEIAGTELKQNAFEVINSDMSTQKLSLWTLEERDALITPKEYHLRQRIFEAEVRCRAWHSGLITDMLPSIV